MKKSCGFPTSFGTAAQRSSVPDALARGVLPARKMSLGMVFLLLKAVGPHAPAWPTRPAEMGPRQHGDPFLLSRQRHGMDFRIFERAVDQHSVPGIGHIGKLRDIPVTQDTVDLIWPHRRIGHDRGSSRLDILCLRI